MAEVQPQKLERHEDVALDHLGEMLGSQHVTTHAILWATIAHHRLVNKRDRVLGAASSLPL